ncbi:ThiF family adenylyltransferase [Promicromonospora thailandica]|uniref:Adenylyltransferase and sulfurtransferase n=1 Tax=Promicromonospora thailandica TaxID=765201 RepID=A0A9X2G3V5_9MICO|nr:ThiF family adenylyltransferase [Promicromonospora thailandica]MCP2265310.1 adenylyltransferase and sulfurtransferase [Promicromonospora thailandica]BFF16836.1 adenylyltransferase/sulfurtransferase MoeZ [Promicromonospora thailandica]
MTALAPLVAPGAELGTAELARYARHLALPGVGPLGQRRLANARVLVVGAGGLGSPALLYLAAAGVGTLGVVDDDVVEVSNLQRQVVHGVSDVGRRKTASARDAVAEVNPHVTVVEHPERLTPSTVLDVLSGYDLVLDGTDSFATRYLVSDAAEILGIPCVWGAIYRFTGQVSTFWGAPPAGVPGVTYRDVFPVPPPPGASPDCATGGVLGAMCGTVGSVMATEAIKLVTGAGESLLGRLAVYDALALTWRQLAVAPDPARDPVTALLTGSGGADPYAVFCGLGPVPAGAAETAVGELAALRADGSAPLVLDVREPWEVEAAPFPGARVVPSGRFTGAGTSERAAEDVAAWAAGRPVHVLCQAGARSARVAGLLREAGIDARSVAGGMAAWAVHAAGPVPGE